MMIEQLVKRQKNAFQAGKTLMPSFRKEALRRLLAAIEEYHAQIEDALMKDLNKPPFEFYMTEYALVMKSIKSTLALWIDGRKDTEWFRRCRSFLQIALPCMNLTGKCSLWHRGIIHSFWQWNL